MAIFGYDREAVDRMVDEGARIMSKQRIEIKHQRIMNERLARENRELERKYKRERVRADEHEESVQTLEKDNALLSKRSQELERRVAKLEDERAGAGSDHNETVRELGQAERTIAKLERRVHELEIQVEQTNTRAEEVQFDLDDAHREIRTLQLKLSEAKGVIEGLMVHQNTTAGAATTADDVRKGQAALARAHKKTLSPDARLRAFEQAKELLGDLPNTLETEMKQLAAGNDMAKALPEAPTRRRKTRTGR